MAKISKLTKTLLIIGGCVVVLILIYVIWAFNNYQQMLNFYNL